jgi:ATP-dependent DNA ligase
MQKMKSMRTAECVVGGFRYASKGKLVGSLLLGLYDDGGCCTTSASRRTSERREAGGDEAARGAREGAGVHGQAPGGPSRWSTARSAEWQPLAPKLVVEVQYDHFSGGRFRHGTSFLRWRPDKPPRRCTIAQVEQEGRSALKLLSR